MTVWTEEVIENTIFELMKDIGIEDDRMPTHKEMVNNRLSGLGAADIYLIPSNAAITTTINVTIGGNSKYDRYKNKWELIGRLLTGIDEALAI